MKGSRRRFLSLVAGAGALAAVTRKARAQSYPSRPVRMIVGLPAGGGADSVARKMGQWLSERLGQPFVIENRPGAGATVGTEAVVKAAADGYTLLMVVPANVINAMLYTNLSFNFIRDTAPIAAFMRVPLVMEVNPSFPAKTVPEFIAYAKTHPGTINMASAGVGSSGHVAGELFKMMAGVDLLHVPYRGGAPAIADLLGGRVQLLFDPVNSSTEYIRAGRLRALAVTGATRSKALPDVPIVGDIIPGFEASAIYGLAGPRDTPAAIVERLNKEVNAALVDPEMKAWLADQGGALLPGSPANFSRIITAETDKWAKVVRAANIKVE